MLAADNIITSVPNPVHRTHPREPKSRLQRQDGEAAAVVFGERIPWGCKPPFGDDLPKAKPQLSRSHGRKEHACTMSERALKFGAGRKINC